MTSPRRRRRRRRRSDQWHEATGQTAVMLKRDDEIQAGVAWRGGSGHWMAIDKGLNWRYERRVATGQRAVS